MTAAKRERGAERVRPADVAFGRAVHHCMWDHGVTQTKLAKLIGMNQGDLSKKIHGKKRWLLQEAIAVADSLQVDARDLLASMWGTAPTGAPTLAPVAQRIELPPSKRTVERRKMDRLLRLVPVAA